MPSRTGFYFFAGLFIGAVAGHLIFRSPAVGALFVGIGALATAIYLDRRDEKKQDEAEKN
jgi:hypothetical protein